ncbi:hypothetical protein GCM10009584_14300 [Ornithinimicrobium humiphilum]|uniref:Lipoprotein n=1 Tax=Ornithinimicrobium humiphilum TaxID=125288 RepID=A0A543KKB4_9MICO|nr:hypothetical protein [Ornithinimicrobium humiphilum]TQM95523.1 hypothetical protein FB476_0367 [Ornithinimicrobium humiphilum]
MSRTAGVVSGVAFGAMALTGCGGGATDEAAQAAYDACADSEADAPLFRLDGDTVHVELKGDNARQLGNMPDIAGQIGTDPQDMDLSGFGVGLALLAGLDCMSEHTGFPGASSDLEAGDEWEGWRYTYESGAGSEETHSFTATS